MEIAHTTSYGLRICQFPHKVHDTFPVERSDRHIVWLENSDLPVTQIPGRKNRVSESLELLTVRGYTDELWRKYARGPQVFVRQATQSTVRVVRKRS